MPATETREIGGVASLGASTLAEAFQLTAARCASQTALQTRDGAQRLSWAEYARRVRAVAGGLSSVGIGRGDTVALMLTNRPEFHLLDTAAIHLGATPFSIYNTYPPEQIAYLLASSGSKVVATERSMLGPVSEAARSIALEAIVVVDGGDADGALTLNELESRDDGSFDFEATWRSVEPSDVLTVIYTSGTTGPPKGVELTHANMLATLRGYAEVIEFPVEGRVISWLPMAHVAERACSH